MAKTKISEFSTTANNNSDINSINISEGCAPSGINDAIRELMRQLKEFQTGGAGDSVNSGGDFSVATNKFTVASASGNTAVAGTLGVTGAATLSSTLAVTGTTTLTGALVANGNATLGDASGDTVTIKGTPTLEVNPTLSGGTANGVLYLNGSKVATSGTALTFTGANLGVGIATALQRLHIYESASSTGAFLQAQEVGGQNAYFGVNTSGGSIQVTGANPLQFAINGSEQMRLTSTGLGIGTSSPATKLAVYTASATGTYARIENTAGFLYTGVKSTGVGYVATESNTALELGTNGTVRATFDTSGNLGLGVTPSAWSSAFGSVLQVKSAGGSGGAFAGSSADNFRMFANTFYDGAYKRVASGYATQYEQASGQHAWYTAGTSTANSTITFTQAMTLDASGNLAVGTTSSNLSGGSAGSQVITVSASSSGRNGILELNGTRTTSGDYVGYVRFFNNAAATPLADIQAIRGSSDTTGVLAFATSGTERARIDSSGNLLVGTTSAISAGKYSSSFAGATENGIILQTTLASTGSTFIGFVNSSGSIIGSVTQNGASTVAYNTSSDYRLKNVIGNVTGSGARIDALEPIEYEWKASGERTRGFLAHKFQEVYPQSVTGTKDAVDADGNPVYQAMQASTSEVIADLVAEIQSLRKRLADAGIA